MKLWGQSRSRLLQCMGVCVTGHRRNQSISSQPLFYVGSPFFSLLLTSTEF